MRPAGTEWVAVGCGSSGLPAGTPLLIGGRLQSASRDASWWNRPDVRSVKAAHVVVSSQLGHGAACDSKRIMLDTDGTVLAAAEVGAGARCRRAGCAALFARADEENRPRGEAK